MIRLLALALVIGGAAHAAAQQKSGAAARLGAGHRLFAAGEYEAARRELAKLDLGKIKNPDYALYLLAQSELLTGKNNVAVQHFAQLATLPGRFRVVARFRHADALWAAGNQAEARRAYEAALPSATGDVEAAVALFRLGETARFRRVFVEFPLHPLAEAAREKFEPSAADRVLRAKTLTQGRAWQSALDELKQLPDIIPAPLRDEADYWIGMTHFRMRRGYEIAAEKLLAVWSRLPGDDRRADALFHGARAHSRADQDDEAQKGYREVVTKFPRSKFAAEASFLVGWLDFNRARYKESLPSLEETLRKFGSSQWEDDARWHLGFSRWLLGDAAHALGDFEKLSQKSGPLAGGKGAYWRGRALEKLGRLDEAKAVWRKLVGDHPFSYYALSARARLRENGVELGHFGDGGKGSAPALGALAPQGEVTRKLDAEPAIQRVDELLQAGLTVEAGVELRRAEGDLTKKLGRERALPLLFDRYLRAQDFHRAHRLAEAHAGGALRIDPHADANARAWWERVYPRAYREYVEKYGPSGENPPYYLYTIMLKESAYNPHDVSYADAIGLLQMIPPTSRRVANNVETPYTDDVLYDPEGNIKFGAWYIGHLLKKFKGQIAIGAGSYNAGPGAMVRWLKKNGERPLDEFVELCPYTQTREYMKKALDIYARYVYLYEKEDYLPAAKVDAAYLEDDGIDY